MLGIFQIVPNCLDINIVIVQNKALFSTHFLLKNRQNNRQQKNDK